VTTLLTLKVILPLALLAGGVVVFVLCGNAPKRPLTPRQTSMIDSLRSASPSHKDLR